MDVQKLANAVIHLGSLALAFGRIDRTHVYHPDGQTPESDSDHTVMLGWIAPALSEMERGLRVGLVAEFALVHDAAEVYAGDTPTLKISEGELADKKAREEAAVLELSGVFKESLPWFAKRLVQYENQVIPEARFVRGVDKVLPKIVHLIDGAVGLQECGMGVQEFWEFIRKQAHEISYYCGEWPTVMSLHHELAVRVAMMMEDASESSGIISSRRH